MNVQIEQEFPNWNVFHGDVFVVDYTNDTKSKRKLEFLPEKPQAIECFELHNRQNITIYGVNFEKNSAYVAGNPMCECLFTSQRANNRPWVMLLEMKYSERSTENSTIEQIKASVEANSMDAYLKLKRAYTYLHDVKGLINPSLHKIYLVLSIPTHPEMEPFESFSTTQDASLSMFYELGVTVFAVNSVLIATPNFLIAKPVVV